MKYSPYSLLVLIFLLFFLNNNYAQGPGSLFVDAGIDTLIPCGTGGCADITADYLEIFETFSTNYTVASIPYSPDNSGNPPFPFNGLANNMNPNLDDTWSVVETLPFDFCFFGSLEQLFQVGSNGLIRFDVGNAGDFNDWGFNEDLPNNTDPALGEGNIFTPVHDIDPSVADSDEIGYEVLGTYPNRVLVVSYFAVSLYSSDCNNLRATHMAVLYEFSNVIEIYIQDKPVCPGWNDGNAALGIQNNDGDIAYVPPGRNTSDSPWTAFQEAWSFKPDGVETFAFEWLDSTGTVIGYTDTINVCPAGGSEIFTARVTYTNTCNGDVVVLEDDVLVSIDSPFTVDLGPDVTTCDTPDILLDAEQENQNFTYQWFLDGTLIAGATSPNYLVTAPNSGTYSVEVIDPSDPICPGIDQIIITYLPIPIIANPPIDLFQCDNGTNTGIFDLTINTPVVLGPQNPADFVITYHNTALDAENDLAPIAAPTLYPITGSMEEIFVRIEGEGTEEDLIFVEDFSTGLGRVTHPFTPLEFNGTTELNPNQYTVTNISTGLNAGWHQDMEDHTIGDIDGRMILFDVSEDTSETELYRRDITVTANTELVFDFAMTTVYDIDTNICPDNGTDSRLIYQIEDSAGTVLATSTTGNVTNGSSPNWITYSLDFDSGVNTIVQIVLINDIFGSCGNDLAIDDIKIVKTEICFATDSFFIEFFPISIGIMTDVEFCDLDADGFVDLNLPSIKDAEALNGLDPLQFTVTYHGSQADADNNVGVYPDPYTVTGPTEEIFVRVENNATPTCFVTDSFLITLILAPIAILPTPYILCDEFSNDGFAEFDLTTKDIEITGGDPNTVITYHLTLAEADANINPVETPAAFINTISSFQILYPRVENTNNIICFDTTELVLQVDRAPAITNPIADYFLCDNDGDGLEVFDLLSKDLEIVNTQIGLTLGYYLTQEDAEAQPPTNIIPNPETYSNISNPETIWVRAENSANCITVLNFYLIVGEVPAFTEVPVFALCDDLIEDGFTEFDLNTQNANIVAGNTDLSVTYYGTQADADLAQSPLLSPYTNTVNPEIIYVRVDDNVEGCYGVFEMELQVISPIAIVPDPLEYCDPDNDGFGEFTLTDADSQITGGNPSGNLQVTYHYLLEDAQNGVNPLASPYLNDVPFTQIVYVRLLDESTGCYGTTTLELIVLPSPQIIQPSDLALCDQDGDGIEVFDLTVSESELLNGLDPLLYSIAYYQDAGLTIPIVDPTTYANIPPSPQTIYIVVEDIANQCKSQTILQLWVYLSPVLVPPLPYELCDLITQDDGFESFDLESKTAEITGGDFTISITYHQTQADANTGNNPLLSPYTNTSNPQTIFLRAENTNGGDLNCFSFIGVTLDLVVNPLPSPVTPTPLEVCDQDNNGITQFILTDKDVEIIGGEPGVEISYHETLLDAESGTNPLASPYTNIDTYMQTIYARAEYPIALGGTGCFQIVSLELLVNLSPIISSEIPDLVICDDDGFTVFDLTQRADDIYGSQDPLDYDLSYYISQVDADLATNAIASPTAFTNTANPQTIWVRLEDNPINNPTACFKVGSFELVVELEPVFTPVPIFEQCDDQIQDGFTEFNLNIQNGTITGGDSTLGVTYYANQIDADDAINPLVIPYTNTVNPETIYVRIESTITGCYGTFPMSLLVRPAPMIFEPSALEHCDSGNDGFGEFMLTDSDLEVTGGVPIGNLQVSYHYLLEDAQNDVNPLLSPYLNDIPNLQTVHVRLVDQSTGCYSITTLDLIVLETPQIISPTDMILCDDNADGIEVFDLTLGELELLSIADPAGGPYSITYYEDAELTIAITNPTAYSNIPPSPQTIYIVVEGVSNGCRVETTLLLWVVSSPILLSPTALELCDTTEIIGPDDEFEPFDLESKTDEITGGDPTVGITYHETQLDADTGINSLISPYINISNPQTIFIRAEAQDTQCIVSEAITLSLVVTPLPSPVTPSPLAVCDVDNDGFSFFMLTDKDSEIIAGEPGVVVSYYETLLDAEAGIFALTSPYINIVTPSQIIYARAEYSIALGGTGCFRIVDLELIVNPSPIVPLDIPDLVICDDDGFTVFDLTQREGDIYGSQDPLDYTLSYHTSQADAIAGTNPIANPAAFPNTINPQIIWVRLEDNTTVCFKVGSFEIRSELGPLVIQPTPFTSCDDLGAPNDGVTLFDLTLKTTEITGGASGVTVQYYESQVDAELDTNVIDPDTAYQNTSNPQTIWLRVSDVNTLCFDTTVYLTLRVVANPAPEDPDPIILCDVNNPGDGEEVFDLTIREPQILDGETWDVSYYNTYQDAVDDNAPIVLPTAYSNVINPEIVYVRVSIDLLDTTACFEIVELTLMVSSLPDDTAVITPYIICEIPGDGESIFDLTTKIDEILNGQDPTIFQVLFYESQAEADLMINEIQNPVIYANTSNPQRIYVVILNIDTDCFVSTQSFDIEEREGAIANIPLDPYAICDYWDENDGIAEFDLLDQDLLDEILGTQDPLVYQLDFYGTLENAELEVSPLPATYVNIINPQIIYARVTNINTECYDLTEVILKVELIPELALDDFYRLCVDSLGNPIPAGNTSPPVIDTGLDPSIYMFEWQLNSEVLLGEIGASITVLQEGIYTVRVTEILTGCMSMATTTVITSSPPLNYSAEVTNAFASEHTITATTDGTGDYEFQLDDNPFQESGIFLDVEPGSHVITIKDVSGCGASVTISVGVIDYPQFMTPNEDGYHDTWNIIGIANGDPTAKIYIFDRYGKLLKQLSIFSEGWDGSYNGKPMPSSDYWFRVEYTENAAKKIFKGHFTLKR